VTAYRRHSSQPLATKEEDKIMKQSWKDIEELIVEMGKVKFSFFYSTSVNPGWSLFYGDETTEYQVYINYTDPKDIDMYFVAHPPFIFNLSAEDKKLMENDKKYIFCFMTLIQLIEDKYGVLPKKLREKVSDKADEIFK